MEKAQTARQYEYKANSNLVLTSSERSRDIGPSAEVMTLSGTMAVPDMVKLMGERAGSTKTPEMMARIAAAKKRRETEAVMDPSERTAAARRKTGSGSGASETVTTADIEQGYQPQTKETKQAWEVLLSTLSTELGGIQHELLKSLAGESLYSLKEEKVSQPQKRKALEAPQPGPVRRHPHHQAQPA